MGLLWRRWSEVTRELFGVLRVVSRAESWRRRASLHAAISLARGVGQQRPARTSAGRARLKRLIRVVDRRYPGGDNCVRRALVEMALDSGAANETFYAGLREGGGAGSGHAWLASDSVTERYDAVIAI